MNQILWPEKLVYDEGIEYQKEGKSKEKVLSQKEIRHRQVLEFKEKAKLAKEIKHKQEIELKEKARHAKEVKYQQELRLKEENKLKQEIKYDERRKAKRAFVKEKGTLVASLFLVIVMVTTITMGISSWNTTSKAMSQEEIQVKQLPQGTETLKSSIQETITEIENNTLKDVTQKVKEPVIKKIAASNGKKYDTIAYLNIPSLGINYTVLSSTSVELLKVSLNKYWGPNPNEVGNLCIVGHNYNDSRFFGKLNQIKMDAEIQITDMNGNMVRYKPYKTMMVDPYDTSCTSQLTDGKREITLITCNIDGSARFVVKAREIE